MAVDDQHHNMNNRWIDVYDYMLENAFALTLNFNFKNQWLAECAAIGNMCG